MSTNQTIYLCNHYTRSAKHADTIYLLHLISFLRENSQNEFSILIRLEGRWHNAVSARRQLEATWNLPHVDERWGASNWCCVLEVAQVQWPRNTVWVSQLFNISVTTLHYKGKRKNHFQKLIKSSTEFLLSKLLFNN